MKENLNESGIEIPSKVVIIGLGGVFPDLSLFDSSLLVESAPVPDLHEITARDSDFHYPVFFDAPLEKGAKTGFNPFPMHGINPNEVFCNKRKKGKF